MLHRDIWPWEKPFNTCEKMSYFLHVCKAFTILNTNCLSELLRIMAVKIVKGTYCWQKVKKTNILNEKPKVTYLVALVLAFLPSENENRQLEDLSLAYFGRLPKILLLSVWTKSINESFVNWELRPLLFLIMIQRIFPS